MTNTHFIMLILTIIIIIILIGALSIKDKRSKLPSKPKPEVNNEIIEIKDGIIALDNRSTTDNTISYTIITRTYVAPRRSHRYYRNYPVKNI